MEHPENNINWDELERQLDGNDLQSGAPENISGREEYELLNIAGKIQATMKKFDPEEKFPAIEGWNRLQVALENGDAPVIQMKKRNLRKWFTVAAALTGLSLITFLWMNSSRNKAGKPAIVKQQSQTGAMPEQIRLTLANGETIEVNETRKVIKDQSGKEILLDHALVDFSKSSGEQVAPVINTIEVPKGKIASLILPDGTKVWLNAASILKFPSAFTTENREVTLKGEAYFEVAHNQTKPFLLRTGALNVEVLGTSFNANCYTPDQLIALTEGKVKVSGGNQSVLLQPGEAADFIFLKQVLSKTAVDLREHTGWKDGELVFHNLPLRNIADVLGRSYNCEFRFESDAFTGVPFTLDIPRPTDINEILEMISQSTPGLHFKKEGSIIHVQSK